MADDNMFGSVSPMLSRVNAKGEPINAIVLSWALGQSVCFLGNVNSIASLVTISWIAVYAALNFAALTLEVWLALDDAPGAPRAFGALELPWCSSASVLLALSVLIAADKPPADDGSAELAAAFQVLGPPH